MTEEEKKNIQLKIEEIEIRIDEAKTDPAVTRGGFFDAATKELTREVKEHPEADVHFSEEIPTSPELRVQIRKNAAVSRSVVTQASSILETLKRASSRPPKE